MSEKQFTGKVSQMKTSSKFLASEDFIGLGEIEVTISGVFEHADEVMQDGKKKRKRKTNTIMMRTLKKPKREV